FSARVQRRYGKEKTASSAVAACVKENGDAGALLRLCGRCAAGRGDGAERGRAGDWRSGPLSDGEAVGSGEAGIPFTLARRVAGHFGPFAKRKQLRDPSPRKCIRGAKDALR